MNDISSGIVYLRSGIFTALNDILNKGAETTVLEGNIPYSLLIECLKEYLKEDYFNIEETRSEDGIYELANDRISIIYNLYSGKTTIKNKNRPTKYVSICISGPTNKDLESIKRSTEVSLPKDWIIDDINYVDINE